MFVKHEGNAAKQIGADDIALEGHALADNRVHYHVFAVTGLCLPFLFHLRLLVASQLAMLSRVGSKERDVAEQRVRFIAGRRPAIPNTSISAFLAPQRAARDSNTQILFASA